jgi:glycosyltransferase involved in cell wall biosynthesis
VRDLRSRGHTVRILTTDYRRDDPDPEIPEDADVRRELDWYWLEHDWRPLPLRRRLGLERSNQRVLDHHLDEFRPDAVIWWAMGGMSFSLIERVKQRGLPGVGVVVDDWLLYGPKYDQWQRVMRKLGPLRRLSSPLFGVPARLTFDTTIEWVLVSQIVLGHARHAHWGLPRRVIAPAGVDGRLFGAQPAGPWHGRLLCVGRLDPRKGVHTAIAALEHLPDHSLTIVGGGDDGYRATLVRMVEDRGLTDRVSFEVRSRAELPAVYAAADAVLFPVNWDEPFGLVPLEAMAVGRPVVASGTGGSAEFLTDGENCLIYAPAEDAGELAGAVRRLAGDEQLRAHLRTGGSATAARLDETAFNAQVVAALERTVA